MSEIENGETPLDPQLRERLRAAMDGETSSPELAERIRAGIADSAHPPSLGRSGFGRPELRRRCCLAWEARLRIGRVT